MKMRIMKILTPAIISLFLFGACGEKADPGSESGSKPEAGVIGEADGAGHGDNLVTLSSESLLNMELRTEPARMGSLDMKLKVPGRITVDANRTAKVSATLEGRITELKGDLGDKVSSGDVLGLIESPELLDKALALKAPVSGVIMEKSVTVGELVEKGKEIYTLSDPRFLWLIGEVKEQDIALVHPGQMVDFKVLAYPKEFFRGILARVGNEVETDSRTFEIRVEVDNRNGKLKPGMFADIRITTEVLHGALLVSDAALQTDGEDRILFVALDSTRFERRSVKVGGDREGVVQIMEGLKVGEKVVTEGSFTLKSEMLKGELGEE